VPLVGLPEFLPAQNPLHEKTAVKLFIEQHLAEKSCGSKLKPQFNNLTING
jgi:hypothetical protein